MATNHIIPTALEYQTKILKDIKLLKEVFPDTWESLSATQRDLASKISELVSDITLKVSAMVRARAAANSIEDSYRRALAYHGVADSLIPIRRSIDELEEITDNDLWPLPKYREILFIN